MNKNTINDIRVGKCYNCLCRACAIRHCPYAFNKSLITVCEKRCKKFDKKSNLKPVLACDFFEHCQINHIFKFKRTKIVSLENKCYYVYIAKYDRYAGFFTLAEATGYQQKYGGIIKQINFCDFNRDL
ncbi:hypothetical protein Osc1_18430 [Hominimerdicola sp. 21CYCFAH17_S]